MTTNPIIRHSIAILVGASLLAPSFAFAETAVDAALQGSANTKIDAGGIRAQASASTTISAAVMTRAKSKASQEIDRRVKALTELSTRINAMIKVTADLKTAITTNINNQIAALNTLNTKIQADTDGAALRADVQSVTQAYRVFVLVIPQARIAAAADREATIINMLAEMGAKLQSRLQTAAAAGADVTALSSALTDMGAKLGTAQTHAQTAITTSVTLTPDGGDAAKMKSNTDALKAARAEIAAAQKDLAAARKDVDTIVKGLKTLKVNTSASGSVQTP